MYYADLGYPLIVNFQIDSQREINQRTIWIILKFEIKSKLQTIRLISTNHQRISFDIIISFHLFHILPPSFFFYSSTCRSRIPHLLGLDSPWANHISHAQCYNLLQPKAVLLSPSSHLPWTLAYLNLVGLLNLLPEVQEEQANSKERHQSRFISSTSLSHTFSRWYYTHLWDIPAPGTYRTDMHYSIARHDSTL